MSKTSRADVYFVKAHLHMEYGTLEEITLNNESNVECAENRALLKKI